MNNTSLIKEYAEHTRPIINELNEIPGTFITGSAAVGGWKPLESDIDVVVPIEHIDVVNHIRDRLAKSEICSEPSSYNNGFKFVKPGHTIPVNVVILHPFDYCAWLFATNTLMDSDTIHDRNARHRAFELAVLLFKTIHITGNHTTTDGASLYCTRNKRQSVIEGFEHVIRENIYELPF